MPKHRDPHYQPTPEELEEPVTLEGEPSPDDVLRALLNPTRQPKPEWVEYWNANGGGDIL